MIPSGYTTWNMDGFTQNMARNYGIMIQKSDGALVPQIFILLFMIFGNQGGCGLHPEALIQGIFMISIKMPGSQ